MKFTQTLILVTTIAFISPLAAIAHPTHFLPAAGSSSAQSLPCGQVTQTTESENNPSSLSRQNFRTSRPRGSR